MSAKICIEVSDDGQLSVGIEPAGEEMAEGGMGEMEEDKSYMAPVADERELLMKVRELVSQAQNPEASAENSAAFEGGFKKAGGVDMKGLMGGGMKGPM